MQMYKGSFFLRCLVLFFLPFGLLSFGGCSKLPFEGCTAMGCLSSFELTFESAKATFEDGFYDFSLDVGELKANCRLHLGKEPSTECPKKKVFMNLLQKDKKSITVTMQLSNDLKELKIWNLRLMKGAKELVKTKALPKFTRSAPNGEKCGPICFNIKKTYQVD